MDNEVLAFIQHFKGSVEVFLNGCCCWFAFILQARFGGTMMYEPVENHFMQEIGGRLYDCSGDVTDQYQGNMHLMPWSAMQQYNSLLYERIIRDCIRKEPYDD